MVYKVGEGCAEGLVQKLFVLFNLKCKKIFGDITYNMTLESLAMSWNRHLFIKYGDNVT